jgi:oligopeptide transport system permease protein
MSAVAETARRPLALAQPEPRVGNARRALRRFFRQKLAVLGLIVSLALIAVGLFAPLIAPTSYEAANLMDANQFPSRQFPLGTDAIGHDYLSRVIYGLRTSLIVGFSAVALACAIGIPLGLLAGLRGGVADFLVLRLVEIMTAFPGILFAMFLVSITGGGVRNIVIVIGLTSWVTLCRLTRGQLLTLREQEYVQAARSLGAGEARVAWRHLLPNALPPLIVAITLAIPTAIFVESGLSFLGIGINEPTPSLGKMVADSAQYISVYPGVALLLTILAINLVGDQLRDVLNPRLSR